MNFDTMANSVNVDNVEEVYVFPMSYAQERLWFVEQLVPGTAAYNAHFSMRLRGQLNVELLKRGLQELVRRHESLRTSFRTEKGRPMQAILHPDQVRLDLPVIDLEDLALENRQPRAQQLVNKEAATIFDLGRAPLMRALLLRLSAEEYMLLLTLHHIIIDAWSMGILVRELGALYQDRGRSGRLKPLPVQYADYAVWQRQWLESGILEQQLNYWREHLAGMSPLELPADRRGLDQSSKGGRIDFEVKNEVLRGLKEFAGQNGFTLFMVLLACFKVLLQRHTGQEDITVATAMANRNRRELEGVVGLFVNTILLRTDLSGDPAFTELLPRVRDITLQAHTHQDVPFEKLVEMLHPQRDQAQNHVVKVMFILQNAPMPGVNISKLEITGIPAETGAAKFDLSLVMTEHAGTLSGAVYYNADLFTTVTIQRIAEQFSTLMESVVRNPDSAISDLQIAPTGQAEALVREFNRPLDKGPDLSPAT